MFLFSKLSRLIFLTKLHDQVRFSIVLLIRRPIMLLALLVAQITLANTQSDKLVRPEVQQGGSINNAGLKISVTQKGINYLNDEASRALNGALKSIALPDMMLEGSNGRSNSQLYLKDLKIILLKKAEQYVAHFVEPDKIAWTITNMALEMDGNAEGLIERIRGKGDFKIKLYAVDINATVKLSSDDDGYVKLSTRRCEANIQNMEIIFYHTQPRIQNYIKRRQKILIKKLKPVFQGDLCQRIRKMIDIDFNEELHKQPLKVPLSAKVQNGSIIGDDKWLNSQQSKLKKKIKEIMDNMQIDFSLKKDPTVTTDAATVDVKGEISWQGQGKTPFQPNDLSNDRPSSGSPKMFYITASDYVVNSLLYQATVKNLFIITLSPEESPEFSNLLRTTCDQNRDQLCAGTFLPEVAKAYPNSNIEVQFQPVHSPALISKPDKIKILIDAIVTMWAKSSTGSKQEIAKCLVDASGDAKLSLGTNITNSGNVTILKGEMSSTQLSIKLLDSSVKEINQVKVDDFSKTAAFLLESTINDHLAKGIPIPRANFGYLVDPNLTLLERKVRIDTDVKIDQTQLERLIRQVTERKSSKDK